MVQLKALMSITRTHLVDMIGNLFLAAAQSFMHASKCSMPPPANLVEDLFSFYARHLALHIAVGNLPMALMPQLHSHWLGRTHMRMNSSSETVSAALQQQAWMYLSAGCPLKEITLMPSRHPGEHLMFAIGISGVLVSSHVGFTHFHAARLLVAERKAESGTC